MHHAGGNVVDQAKSAGAVAVGMVAGGADGAKSMPGLFVHHHIDCFNNGSGRKTGGLKGVVADDRIVIDAVDFARKWLCGLQVVQIIARVDQCQLCIFDFGCFSGLQMTPNAFLF